MFFKKEETIDSLTKECNELVASFKYSYSKAHSKSYFHFKQKFSGNLPIVNHHCLKTVASGVGL